MRIRYVLVRACTRIRGTPPRARRGALAGAPGGAAAVPRRPAAGCRAAHRATMSPFELSPEQLASIDTFGYLHLPGLLADRAAEMTKAFHALIDELRPRGRDGTEQLQARVSVAPFLNHSAVLCTLLDDPRITGCAQGVCGQAWQYWNSDGNYYVGDTDWHSDGSCWSDEEHHQANAV